MNQRVEAAIAGTLAQWDRTLFIWGDSDCILSVCPYVKMLTGKDPSAGYEFNYWTPEGAYRFLKRHGGMLALARAAMASVGAVEIPPESAARGDVVLCPESKRFTTGINLGDLIAFRDLGARVLARREIVGCFRCG